MKNKHSKEVIMKIYLFILIFISIASCTTQRNKLKHKAHRNNNKTQTVTTNQESINNFKKTLSTYKVEKGDTLLWIAYKLYGDHLKWREIWNMNENLDYRNLKIGQKIYYKNPKTTFKWMRAGIKHHIKNGETLSKISYQYYQDYNNWNRIVRNNQPLINNPNLIFAGFQIFIPPKDQELAKSSLY